MKELVIKDTKDELAAFQWGRLSVYFIVFGVFGWAFETAYVWIRFGRFTYRGYLFSHISFIWGLPFIEMYAIGGIIVLMLFHQLEKRPIKLFFLGSVAMTIFELIGSYFCTFFFQKSFWNYSNELLNFDGRICLIASIGWGILSVIAICVIKPIIEKIYDVLKEKSIMQYCTTVFMVYMFICAFYKYILL